MCSNREKLLVINSGSISIIILVSSKAQKNKTSPKTYSRTEIETIHIRIAHCIHGFCHFFLSFPVFMCIFFLSTNITNIKSHSCHVNLLFLLKTKLYTINTNFPSLLKCLCVHHLLCMRWFIYWEIETHTRIDREKSGSNTKGEFMKQWDLCGNKMQLFILIVCWKNIDNELSYGTILRAVILIGFCLSVHFCWIN